MAKGASMSAAGQSSTRPSGEVARRAGPVGSQVVRRPRPASAGAVSSASNQSNTGAGGIYRISTDTTSGLQLGPTVVLVLSLSFIGFVILLHIIGKYRGV
eukprot:c22116_g1_i1.p1 GENE.c22116_g1_i1~~c22116_g1_i1.p1  ORF type:complete len:100 (+),score=30.69 c22116_g1_i1:45-344(+)